jgi:hypothetical protein
VDAREHRPESLPEGSVPSPDDFPYEGAVGRTKIESTHVTIPDGFLRSVQVYSVINVATDPHLKEAALAGALHRFESGEPLAVPFVYHDPDARKLALVLPEVLRHHELRERARLLERIADDPTVSVPRYVREATVVIGGEELQAYVATAGAKESAAATGALRDREAKLVDQQTRLDAAEAHLGEAHRSLGEREKSLGDRDRSLGERQRALAEREKKQEAREAELRRRAQDLDEREATLTKRTERLAARAESVTTLEDEQRMTADRLEAETRELAVREQELEARFEMLRQREAQLAEQAQEKRQQPSGRNGKERRPSSPPPPASAPPPVAAAAAARLTLDPPSGEVQEIGDVEGLVEEIDPQTSPEVELADAAELVDGPEPSLADEVEQVVEDGDVEDLEADEAQHVDDGELEPIEEVDTGVRGSPSGQSSRPPPSTQEDALEEAKTSVATLEGAPEFMPPAGFLDDPDRQMVAEYNEGRIWLFARLGEGHETAFRTGVDLLAQLVVVQGYPVVVLALVEKGDDGRPYARRAALDPARAADRRVLEHLRRNFAASVALFGPEGAYERTFEVEAPRTENVVLLLERVSRFREEPKVDGPTAVERALAAPPPVRQAGHPFELEPQPAKDADAALAAVQLLADWSRPEKLDRAILALSIPRDAVDASFRQILKDAIRWGIALPAPLLARGVSLGIGAEPGEIVSEQIEAFRKVVAATDHGGLLPEQIAENWERMLQSASENEVALDAETHQQAWRDIKAIRGVAGPAAEEVDPAKLPELGPPQLVVLLDHPKLRRDAAIELCRRGDAEFVGTLYKAVRKMPRDDVVAIVPRVVAFGEAAGDALIDGLSARKTFVRQASALALGQLKLRRAVVPLVHLLQNEPTDVWQEVARVLAEFAAGALRTVTRAMKDAKAKGQEERFAYCLAHMFDNGMGDQVQKLTDEPDRAVASIALSAMTFRDVVKKHTLMVRGERDIEADDSVRAFSRRFYEELGSR